MFKGVFKQVAKKSLSQDKMERCYGCNAIRKERSSESSSEDQDLLSLQLPDAIKIEGTDNGYLCAACTEEKSRNSSEEDRLSSPIIYIEDTKSKINIGDQSKSKSKSGNGKLHVIFETIKAEPEIITPQNVLKAEPEIIIAQNVSIDSTEAIDDSDVDVTESNESILPLEIDTKAESTLKKVPTTRSREKTEMKEKFPIVKIHQMDLGLETEESEKINFENECTNCFRNFSTAEYLNAHFQAVHTEVIFKYECFFCTERFCFEWFLKNHLETIHSGIVIRFTCPVCKITCYTQSSLEEHKRRDHNLRQQPFNCNHCEESFASIEQLRKHLIQFHEGTTEAENADSNVKLRERFLAGNKQNILVCRPCKKTFVTVQMKKNHLDAKHKGKHVCTCGKSFNSNKRLVQHEWTHEMTTKDFKCEICASSFSTSMGLDLHYKIHNSHFKPEKFVCSKCRKSFLDETFLRHHISQDHPSSSASAQFKIHTCAKCGKMYKNLWLLRAHERHKHSFDETPTYPCPHCDLKFYRIHNLNKHIICKHKKPLTNNEEKELPGAKSKKEVADLKEIDVMTCFSQNSSKFSCPVCVYSTERKNHFRRHLKGVHSITSSQSQDNVSTLQMKLLHKCLKCDKMFARKDLLYTHDRLRHVQVPPASIKPNPSRPLMIECGVCKKNIPTGQLILHVNRHKSSVIIKKKKIDMNDLFCEESRMFQCCSCSEKIAAHKDIVKHLQEVHNSTVVFDRLKNVREGFPFQCSKCDMRLASKFHWREHELRHGNLPRNRSKTNKVKVEIKTE